MILWNTFFPADILNSSLNVIFKLLDDTFKYSQNAVFPDRVLKNKKIVLAKFQRIGNRF